MDRPPHTSDVRRRVTRRDFLASAGAAAAVSLAGRGLFTEALAQVTEEAAPQRSEALSRVAEIRSELVLVGRSVHPTLLRDMLAVGLTTITGRKDPAEAWRTLLAPDDVVGLKFNQSASASLGVTPPMVEALVGSLTAAGWDAKRIVPIEIPDALYEKLGTTRPRQDWLADEVQFGEVRDRLSGVLEQVTAIVNVPFLKHHNIAGVTCCLKNLSHALVKHPARLHGNKCAPYIGDIVALPAIRQKLRLHVVNALRIVTDKGPEATEPFVHDYRGLLFGVDPVAVDAIGLEILNRVRTDGGLGKIEEAQGEIAYLSMAASRGLGHHELHEVEHLRVRI
jgi:hypothetical protein